MPELAAPTASPTSEVQVWGSGVSVVVLRFLGSRFRVLGSGFRVLDSGLGLGFWGRGQGFRPALLGKEF